MPSKVTAQDGTIKLVFPAGGGRAFEAAYFHVPGRDRPYIACVSTQVGCAVRCGFCATRNDGLIRQLSTAEICEEIDSILRIALNSGADESELEVSFMGMGEPLANRHSLIGAIKYAHERYPRMSRVSVSTVGPSDRIVAFAHELDTDTVPVHLQISLHATEDSTRQKLIPGIRDRIELLLAAGREYSIQNGDIVCLNYVLLHGVNDSDADAQWLSTIDPRFFSVKLTCLNEVPDLPAYCRPASSERFRHFANVLGSSRIPYKVFRGDGLDVGASCGQLASRPIQVSLSDLLANA